MGQRTQLTEHETDTMDDQWRTLFNEHTRAPIYTVGHYIAYLRRFVEDTSGSRDSCGKGRKERKGRNEGGEDRRRSDPDGIHPLSYFLRKLKLDLKVSYDSFVRDFVRPQNEGLSLLLRLLTNLQNPASHNSSSQTSSSSSSSFLNRSVSRLEDYKKSVTDEHDCLLCVKFCLRDENAIGQLVQQADGLQRLAAGVQGSSSKARITCLEILTLCLLDWRGVDSVLEAFTVLKLQTGQSVRFKMLVSMLHTKSPSQVIFQVTCLKLFNSLLNGCRSANQRVYLQHELLSAGLDLAFLAQCAEGDGLEYDDLKREVQEWRIRFIDVDALLRRLKDSQRDALGGVFCGEDGPLLVSSRLGSMRSGHGVTYFQPEELAGTVQLGTELRRDAAQRNHRASNNGLVLTDCKPYSGNGRHGNPDNGYNGGLDADDSDSDFISISAQHSLRLQRKFSPHDKVGDPVNRVNSTAKNGFRGNLTGSVQNLTDRHFCQGQRVINGHHEERRGHGESVYPQRRHSVESLLDPYGLVIHRADRIAWGQGQGMGHAQSQGQASRQDAQDVYSNFKLRYVSATDIDIETAENGPSWDHGQLNGSEVGKSNSNNFADSGAVWNYDYPFKKRPVYRSLENGSAITSQTDTTIALRALPLEQSPKGLSRHPGNSVKQKNGTNKNNLLLTPAPDYSPVPTPVGSTRSLNTEVAQVLRDFENTLRAHEPPGIPPSVPDILHAEFV